MLCITLENAGYTSIKLQSERMDAYQDALIDLELDPMPKLGEHCLTWSKHRPDADLLRPFRTTDFLAAIQKEWGIGKGATLLPKALSSSEESYHSFQTVIRQVSKPSENPSGLPCPILLTKNGFILEDQSIRLSPKEKALLTLLLKNIGHPISKEEIQKSLFANTKGNLPEVYISYLRQKLEEVSGKQMIRTVRGKGYILTWR